MFPHGASERQEKGHRNICVLPNYILYRFQWCRPKPKRCNTLISLLMLILGRSFRLKALLQNHKLEQMQFCHYVQEKKWERKQGNTSIRALQMPRSWYRCWVEVASTKASPRRKNGWTHGGRSSNNNNPETHPVYMNRVGEGNSHNTMNLANKFISSKSLVSEWWWERSGGIRADRSLDPCVLLAHLINDPRRTQ